MASPALRSIGGHPEGLGATTRTDPWWVAPVVTLVILTAFAIYATWAAFQGEHYYAAPYLSPLYSPVLFTDPATPGSVPEWHALFGTWPSWWPSFAPKSAALLILVFPGLFRFTCYYYRKAYYRAFAGSPPGCAVVPMAKRAGPYRGETRLLVFQNLHRFALYFALLYVPILYADAIAAFIRHGEFGVGVGTLILLVNATLLGGYTLGCHSFRHLIGGRVDCMSCGVMTLKYRTWKRASWLNEHHMGFAWASLFWVAFTDIYVRLVSQGVIRDWNTWD